MSFVIETRRSAEGFVTATRSARPIPRRANPAQHSGFRCDRLPANRRDLSRKSNAAGLFTTNRSQPRRPRERLGKPPAAPLRCAAPIARTPRTVRKPPPGSVCCLTGPAGPNQQPGTRKEA